MGKNSFVTVRIKKRKYKIIVADLRKVYKIEKTKYPTIPFYQGDKIDCFLHAEKPIN